MDEGPKSHHKLIGEEQVKATLKADKGDEAKLLSWSIEDFTEKGDNYATIVSSVKVSYTSGGKETENVTYIVKINPDNGFESFKPFIEAIFIKEGGFYEHIVPMLNKALTDIGMAPLRVPRWLYNYLEGGNELLFLEDLRPKGFKMFDRKKGLDVPHTILALNELARIHSASTILSAKQSLRDLADKHTFMKIDWHNYDKNAVGNMDMMMRNNFETAADMLHKLTGYDKAEQWLHQSKSKVMTILEKHLVCEEPFVTICHGDCWNNNMLFRYDDAGNPVEVMLVDLQLHRVASPATDLTYLISTSLTGDVRAKNEQHFLSSYYNTYSAIMKSAGREMPFTHQELLQEFNKKLEFGLLFSVMTVMIMVTPSEEVPDIHAEKNGDDFAQFMDEWKEKSMKSMSENPLFKPRFVALFDFMAGRGIFE